MIIDKNIPRKEKISNFPRYIEVDKIGKSKIKEMRNNTKIKKLS